jgi:hypothetical protein
MVSQDDKNRMTLIVRFVLFKATTQILMNKIDKGAPDSTTILKTLLKGISSYILMLGCSRVWFSHMLVVLHREALALLS